MKEIKAKENMYLTQKLLDNDDERLFVKAIMGITINEEDWIDATQEEKDLWDKAQNEKYEQILKEEEERRTKEAEEMLENNTEEDSISIEETVEDESEIISDTEAKQIINN